MNELNNKENKPVIPIFFASDDNYVPFLAVTLYSLEQNADMNYHYDIKVLNADNISVENKFKILAEFEKDGFDIEFVDVTPFIETMSSKLHTRDYYSKSTYYRLLIPNMYPNYDKALYLDCDIAINDSISNLFNIDIADNYVGAIPDQSVLYMSDEFKDYVENRVGVEKFNQYFNAGILIMNLKKLREINFEDKFIRLLSAVKFDVAQDQDYLNAICCGHVKYVDETWNSMPIPVDIKRPKRPSLVHYNLSFKPWHLDDVIFEEFFWDYARKTSYIETIMNIKKSYSKQMQENTERVTKNLIENARRQADDSEENLRIANIIKEILG